VSRRLQGNLLEALGVLEEAKISGTPDGKITVDALRNFAGQPKQFVEIAPLVYREVGGQDKVAFKRNADGSLRASIDYPFMVFDRASFLQNKVFNLFVLIASLGIMALALIFWPVNGLVRRHYGRKLGLSAGDQRLRTLTRLVCAINVVFVLGMAVVLSSGGITSLNNIDGRLHAVQFLGVIGSIGALVCVYNALRSWRWQPVPRATLAAASGDAATVTSSESSSTGASKLRLGPSRIFETLIAVACIGFTWFLLYWNVLNFSLHY
jgi:hypothetical protein